MGKSGNSKLSSSSSTIGDILISQDAQNEASGKAAARQAEVKIEVEKRLDLFHASLSLNLNLQNSGGHFQHPAIYSRGFIFNNNAFSALSRLGTPTKVSRPSIIVAGTARTECRLANSAPSGVVMSTSR